MEDQELRPEDLIPYIGDIQTVREVLERKRHLTLPMIHKLGPALQISPDILVQEYDLCIP